MSVVTDLQEARELILKEEYWTQNYSAKDALGYSCDPSNPAAFQWCATGALEKVVQPLKSGWDRYDAARKFLTLAANYLFKVGPITTNDEHGHTATIEMFDKAIELAKGYGYKNADSI